MYVYVGVRVCLWFSGSIAKMSWVALNAICWDDELEKVWKPFGAPSPQQIFEIGHGKLIKYGDVLLFGNWN